MGIASQYFPGNGSGGNGNYSLNQLYQFAVSAGADSYTGALLAHIAWAESAGNPHAKNSIGATGLFQFIPYYWPQYDYARMTNDPVYAMKAALSAYKQMGTSPWNDSKNKGNGGGWGQYLNNRFGGITNISTGTVGGGGSVAGGASAGGAIGGHISVAGTLRQGDESAYVGMLQKKLGIPGDGVFGPQTRNALIAFQRSHGLTPDGIYGPQTMAAMGGGSGGGGGGGGGNGIVWPSDTRTITSPFGVTRPGHTHGGIDIGAPMDAPIYAATSGRVITSRADPGGFGWYVQIQAPDGTVTTYGHMYQNKTYVSVGQQVNAGQKIALTGANGDSTGPHLHFEVSIGGKRTDPKAWLDSRGAGNPGNVGAPGGGTGWDEDSISAAIGLSTALFDSDPELRGVLDKVMSEGLTPDTDAGKARFQALLENTQWYKTHSAKQREYLALLKADPAEAQKRLLTAQADVLAVAQQIGIALTPSELSALARNTAEYGLSGNELKFAVASFFKKNASANFGGDLGDTINSLRQFTADMGLPISNDGLNAAAQEIVQGHKTLQDYENNIRLSAKSMFPALSHAIDSGQTVRQAADPYLQTYGSVLERDPAEVDLSQNATIRKALQFQNPSTNTVGRTGAATNAKVTRATPDDNSKIAHPVQGTTENPGLEPLWAFENRLKSDPLWLQTNQAHNALTGAGAQILTDLGLGTTGGANVSSGN